MIKSISIKNIQSHKDTTLDFSNGINCIIGSSNQGKTSIIRALNWVRYNRPLGVDTLASHWIINDRGQLSDDMAVTLINDNGSVTRKRTKTENQYIVNNEVLNVVKSDVPDSVINTLKLTETNIQNQQDSPFLLSSTSGKVAEYLNRIVRLDTIDKVLSNAESKRRKAKQEIEHLEKTISNNEKTLEKYDWLETVGKLINKYERVKAKNEELKNEVEKLSNSINSYESLINKNYDFNVQNKLIDKINKIVTKNMDISNTLHCLTLDTITVEELKLYPDFSEQKELIKSICNTNLSNMMLSVNKLQNEVDDVINEKSIYTGNVNKIKDYKKQLPKVCPVCGQPWDCCKEL